MMYPIVQCTFVDFVDALCDKRLHTMSHTLGDKQMEFIFSDDSRVYLKSDSPITIHRKEEIK